MQVKHDAFEIGKIQYREHEDSKTIRLDHPTEQVAYFLTGFRSNFVGSDHDFGRLRIALKCELEADKQTCLISLYYSLRDNDDFDFDDVYSGKVNFCIVAEP